jgi:hypothetical protein
MQSKRANSGALNRGLWANNKIYIQGILDGQRNRQFWDHKNKEFQRQPQQGAQDSSDERSVPGAHKTGDLGAQQAHKNNNIQNQRNKITDGQKGVRHAQICTWRVPSRCAAFAWNFSEILSKTVFANVVPIANENENERRTLVWADFAKKNRF